MVRTLGMPELVIILALAVFIFGPRRLPEFGRSIGETLQAFKRAHNDGADDRDG